MNGNVSLMKEMNLNVVRQTMRKRRKLSKPQLAELTGLSVVTVNALVKVLLASGEIVADEIFPSSGGRPAASYRFNEMHSLVLVVYMHEEKGADTAFFTVDNLHGESIAAEKIVLREITLEYLDAYVGAFIAKYPAIRVLAFGLPGAELNGRMIMVDYESLRGKSLTRYFAEKYGRAVVVENDLNAAVAGYCHANFSDRKGCVVGIYFPEKYPPGAGIFIHGEIYRGRDGFAGEIAHAPLGIDWAQFPVLPDALMDRLAKIVAASVSFYNPHRLVLYGTKLPADIAERLPKLCAPQIDPALLPEIILSEAFSKDFATGIRHIALRQLEPTRASDEGEAIVWR